MEISAAADDMAVAEPEEYSEERLLMEAAGVTLEEGGQLVGANGALFITSRVVRWGIAGSQLDRQWGYRHILLHAVSRQDEKPNVYCQIAVGNPPDASDDEVEVSELRFIPSDPHLVQEIWEALSEGAALNPDPGPLVCFRCPRPVPTILQSKKSALMKGSSFSTQKRSTARTESTAMSNRVCRTTIRFFWLGA